MQSTVLNHQLKHREQAALRWARLGGTKRREGASDRHVHSVTTTVSRSTKAGRSKQQLVKTLELTGRSQDARCAELL